MYCTDQINYPLESDSQMVSADCPDKYKTVPFHTRCLTPAKYMTKEGINEEEKQKIVDLHDEWRSNADVPASQMMKMVNFMSMLFKYANLVTILFEKVLG